MVTFALHLALTALALALYLRIVDDRRTPMRLVEAVALVADDGPELVIPLA